MPALESELKSSCSEVFALRARLDAVEDDNTSEAEDTARIVMAKLGMLLSTESFLQVLRSLLGDSDPQYCRQALRMFREKVVSYTTEQEEMTTDQQQASAAKFMTMHEDLLKVATGESFDGANRQLAINCLGSLAGTFASLPQFSAPFLKIVDSIIALIREQSTVKSEILSSSILSIAFACSGLGPRGLKVLPVFVPLVLSSLVRASTELLQWTEDHAEKKASISLLLQCSVTSLQVLSESSPRFMKPYMSKIIVTVSQDDVQEACKLLDESTEAQNCLGILTESCRNLISGSGAEGRVILPAILDAFTDSSSVSARVRVLENLTHGIESWGKRQTQQSWQAVLRLLLTVSESTVAHSCAEAEEVAEASMACFISLVLKLNEKRLNTVFSRMCAFAGIGDESTVNFEEALQPQLARRMILYKLASKLLYSLRSIFVPFCGDLVTDAADILSKFAAGEFIDARSDAGAEPQRKKLKRSQATVGEWSTALVKNVTECFSTCLAHDVAAQRSGIDSHSRFITEARFSALISPVTGLIDSLGQFDQESDYTDFMTNFAVPCVTKFIIAVGDGDDSVDNHGANWRKNAHNKVLMHTRSDKAVVRLAALSVVDNCFKEAGPSYLVLLPETIPFLAELLEDEDERVEKFCHEVKRSLSELSGEDISELL